MITLPYADTFLLYSQVERSRSATPYDPNPWQPDDPEGEEKESHEALVKDKGRPCYPIELGFDVFDNPGQYKEILEYWQEGKSSDRQVFTAQLSDWKYFRRGQQSVRYDCRARANLFHEYVKIARERRRIHGLDGDLQLREDVAEQSKLDDWMEYQNDKLRQYEGLEKKLKKCRERLASQRKALAELGYSAFEEIEELEFGRYYGMTLEWSAKEAKAEKKEELAERKLKMAKKRSEAAQSEELGERVEPDRWIGWFTKEVESQRTRLDELQRSADEAERDVEPYDQWWEAKKVEWEEKGWDGWTEEGRRLIKLETDSAEYRTKFDKMQELTTRAHKARYTQNRAGEEVEFAEELLEAARTEDLAQTVERAALIRRTQKEVRFAEFHVEEEKESTKVLGLKRLVIDNLCSIPCLKGKMKHLNLLLDWIEQQRRELAGDSASTGKRSGPRRSMRVSSRAHPSPTEASSVDHPGKKRARLQKPSTATSILDPVDPAKVTKTPKRKGKGRRRTNVPRDTSRVAEKTNVDSSLAEPANEVAVPVKDGIRARLGPVHSSRVSKPAPKKSVVQGKGNSKLSPAKDTDRRTGKDRPGTSSTSSKKAVGRSIDSSSRRSTRVSQRFEDCRLGAR